MSTSIPLQSCKKALPNGKVAHLRVVLKNILPAGKNASALLKDPSGIHLDGSHEGVRRRGVIREGSGGGGGGAGLEGKGILEGGGVWRGRELERMRDDN